MIRRPGMRLSIKIFGVAALLAAPFAQAEEKRLTPQEMEQAALVSLQSRNPAQALVIADALIARDPDDLTPRLLQARALRDLSRFGEAREAASMAWKLAETDGQKYSAALITAQILSSDGKRTRAQLWLRRAVQHAPTPELAHVAKRDFQYVQQQNPWSTDLAFTLAPNSNINNGSIRETLGVEVFTPFGFVDPPLAGGALALSGVEYGGRLNTRYRFAQSETTAHDILFSTSYRSFILSGSARDILRQELLDDIDPDNDDDPIATGADFAFASASLGYRFLNINMDGRGEFSGAVHLGQNWYGGDRLSSFLRTSLSQSVRPSRERKFSFGATAEINEGQLTSDTERLEIFANVDRRLSSRNLLYYGVSLAGQTSENTSLEYTELELRTGVMLAKPIMGATLEFGLNASYRDYDISPYDRSGREDLRLSADVTAVFREIDYYGFNPSVTFSASNTSSNINLYDSNRFGLSFGIRSAF